MSDVNFCWSARPKNLANPYFKNLNQLQKTVTLFLTETFISQNTNTGEISYFRARSNYDQAPVQKE